MTRIAFLVNDIEDSYVKSLVDAVNSAAKKFNLSLVIVIGKCISSQNKYENNCNIHQYITKNNIDGLIIASGCLTKYISHNELKNFITKFNIPSVLLGIPLGDSNICIDNTNSITQMINHLINEHGKKRIAFITGSEFNSDASTRLKAYIETLYENGIEFDKNLILKGDFSYNSAIDAVTKFIESGINFDAIVSADDEMALAAITCLKQHGFRVPQDISVTGFDNVFASIVSEPALTTISQPITEIGLKAIELLIDLIHNNKKQDIIMNTEIIIRESCGCKSNDDIIEVSEHKKIVEKFIEISYIEIAKLDIGVNKVEEFIGNVIDTVFDETKPALIQLFKLLKSLTAGLPEEKCYILYTMINRLKSLEFLSTNPNIDNIIYQLNNILIDEIYKKNSKRSRASLDFINNLRNIKMQLTDLTEPNHQINFLYQKLEDIGITECSIFTYAEQTDFEEIVLYKNVNGKQNEIIMHIDSIFTFLPNKRMTSLLIPLIYNFDQIGMVLFNYELNELNDNSIYQTIAVELSCALKMSQLFSFKQSVENNLKKTVIELENYNSELSEISFTDDMTGLYNRRGFYNISKKSLTLGKVLGNKNLIVYADMDGLKAINDTYGHDEGDSSIIAMSEILKEAFRHNDLISRFGGDEFVILADIDDKFNEKILEIRIQHLVDKYNAVSGKPYRISISLGYINFDYDQDLKSILKEADTILYEKKKLKKAQKIS